MTARAAWRAAGLLSILLLSACAPQPPSLWANLPRITDEPEPQPQPRRPAGPPDAPVVSDTASHAAGDAVAARARAEAARAGPARPTEFWGRLRAGFAVPALATTETAAYRQAYGARPDFLMRALQRGAPYLPGIAARLEQARMPAELALLPVIESGFDTRAVSPAAAAGVWQFIPETGQRYGLRRSWLRDERRDPLAATAAALAYLADLQRQFGDWHLALAAYNCGEGCVARALAQARTAGRGGGFANAAPWLPAETRDYVPRFIAVRDILMSPAAFGVNLPALGNAPPVVRHTLAADADLASVARLAGLPLSELADLNGGVLRQVVPAQDALWLPEPNAARLAARLAAADGAAPMRLKPATALPQERLAAFAARQRTTVAELREINGIPVQLGTIQSGTLFVPLAPGEKAEPLQAAAWAPLRMQGEETLAARPFAGSRRDQELLAAHPKWVESGWAPGRLQLPGRRGQLVRPPSR